MTPGAVSETATCKLSNFFPRVNKASFVMGPNTTIHGLLPKRLYEPTMPDALDRQESNVPIQTHLALCQLSLLCSLIVSAKGS